MQFGLLTIQITLLIMKLLMIVEPLLIAYKHSYFRNSLGVV